MTDINQCDGCRVDAPLSERGNHIMPDGGYISCTKDRYRSSESAAYRRGVLADITGLKIGLLTVIRQDMTERLTSNAYWVCMCDCGSEKSVRGDLLRSGKQKSCGRKHRLNARHGKSGSKVYDAWANMIARCLNANSTEYKNYGGRGISVCDRWRLFENFYADMGDCPNGRSLDRYPDVNGNYEPSNCRWATSREQALNRRTNRLIEIDGAIKTLAEWCLEYGQPYPRISSRINTYKWDPKIALTTPLFFRGVRIEANDE